MINFLYVVFPVVCLSVGFYFGFNIGKTSEMPKATEKIKHKSNGKNKTSY